MFVDHLWEADGDNIATEALARRARLLVAQAAASLVVDELSQALTAAAETSSGEGLDALARQISVGAVATPPRDNTR